MNKKNETPRRVPPALQARYDALKALVAERRESFDALAAFVESRTDYLNAPASTRFHLCRPHGLLEHSINVAETMLRMKQVLAPELTDESCVIVALFHDLGKAGLPGEPLYLEQTDLNTKTKKDGKLPAPYLFNGDTIHLGVPIRSLYLIGPHFPLTPTEAQAIVYHDGQYVRENRGIATFEEPLSLLLQYADNWCGFVVEREES